jgi:hypothetical protein
VRRARSALVLWASLIACTRGSSTSGPGGTDASLDAGSPSRPQPGKDYGPIQLDGYCAARADAECHRLSVCATTSMISTFGDVAGCLSKHQRECEGTFVDRITGLFIQLGWIQFDPSKMGTALSIWTHRSCASALSAPDPTQAVIGLLGDGTGCTDSIECTSGYCNAMNFQQCGKCAPDPGTPPASCPLCPIGQLCRCTPPDDAGNAACSCIQALEEGADCSADRRRCDEGLACLDFDDGSGRRTACRAVPVLGEPCGPSTGFGYCLGDAVCTSTACARPSIVSLGQACDGARSLCPVGDDCRTSCVPKAKLGEACSLPVAGAPDGGLPGCASGPCVPTGTTALCRDPGAQDFSPCFESTDCQAMLGCYHFGVGSGGACRSWDEISMMIRQQFPMCP